MNLRLPEMVLALAGGTALGMLYFGGLWWSLRRLPLTRWPAALMLGSFLGRTMAAVAGLHFVMGGQWQRLLVALAGFFIVRLALVRRLRARTTLED